MYDLTLLMHLISFFFYFYHFVDILVYVWNEGWNRLPFFSYLAGKDYYYYDVHTHTMGADRATTSL